MAQGKKWNKKKVVEVLRPYLKLGYSVRKASIMACIPESTVKTWIGDDPELRLQFKAWQNSVNAKARENLARDISQGNSSESRWWLEKRDDEFNPKQKVETTETESGVLNMSEEELNLAKQLRDARRKRIEQEIKDSYEEETLEQTTTDAEEPKGSKDNN